MSGRSRSVLLVSLVPAVLLGGVFAVVQAQNARAPAAKPTRWSDRASWPDKKVPRAGDKVTIAAGKEVILDVSPPPLGGVTINGKLTFADNADLELTTEWVMVHGELAIGTEAVPYKHKATITLTNNVKDEQLMGMGDRGIMLSGGTLNLHGDAAVVGVVDGGVLDVLALAAVAHQMPVDGIAGKRQVLTHASELDAFDEHLARDHRHDVAAEEGLLRVG
jgi:hypothetical protein